MVGSSKYEWVILDGDSLFCLHCGKREGPLFPLAISKKRLAAFTATTKAFEDEHKGCKETETSPSKRKWTRPEDWLHGHDTGTSSLTIYTVMTGQRVERTSYPLDPDDFGRCYRLLKLFPEWRLRLAEVAARFKEWRPLVREWTRLTALYENDLALDAEHRKKNRGKPPPGACATYTAMQACLAEAGVR